MKKLSPKTSINPINIDRNSLNTKFKNEIVYLELELNSLNGLSSELESNKKNLPRENDFIKYRPVSEFPSSSRDLSFSIKNIDKYYEIQEYFLSYKSNLIKEIFIFDFYNNKKNNEIKIGFRIIFQSHQVTITDNKINDIMESIMTYTNSIDGVSIPGMDKEKLSKHKNFKLKV
jgi:phenylalanyl-tRNA synthetase beta subunit